VISVPLVGGPVVVAGVLDMAETPDGYRLRRLPAWTEAQIPDPMTRAVVAMPSGCRIEMQTDSSVIEVDAMLARIVTGNLAPRPSVFDLVIDGRYVSSVELDEGTRITVDAADPTKVDIERGGPSTVTFSGMGTAMKHVEVWLPHNALVELRALRAEGRVLPPDDRDRRRWLHYGSSISHCMEADRPTAVWPAVAARLADVNLQSFGFGGSCHLDQFVARTIRDIPVDLISVKVGINVINADSLRERTFGPALHGFLDTVRDGHPDVPVLLVSPIFCPSAEDHPGPTFAGPDGRFVTVPRPKEAWIGSMTLRRAREIVREIATMRADNVHYLDGLELFGPADAADLPDDLHPNAAGYQRMGERFHALAFGTGGPFATL
jgi:hypothetical protein